MQTMSLSIMLLLASFGAAQSNVQNIACNSFGIPDGYQNHQTWRAPNGHCLTAIDQMIFQFGSRVPSAEHGCTVVSESQDCEIRVCDDFNVRRPIYYSTVWAAAHAVHSRHRDNEKVAGYVSLDDYTFGGNQFRTFVMIAAKGSPDARGKRRRQTATIGERRQARAAHEPAAAAQALQARDRNEYDFREEPVPETDELNINVQAGWGGEEWVPLGQLQDAQRGLEDMWNNPANDQGTTLRAPGFLGSGNNMIEFEWAANQHNANNAVHQAERFFLLRRLINLRGNLGNHRNFAAQVRRGSRVLGHVIIRVVQLVANQQVNEICG
ncbi:hypothetical protein Micbo1qcDRAFT_208656 [Microdochium bolleyi]|uniref:Uncharacterized protein n=1 Tax=Microdochium bolleyi TaxID=196109 RepID=A0A136IPL6_9PEZI|nr:hypothetical protein Micbo1qcDRAFT_208656 [Microdochium bolleyi]